MKDERNVRHHRAEGARWRPAALLLAAVLIAVSMPFFGKSVFAADPDPVDVFLPCSLTVDSSGIEMQDKQNVVVDLYRVAYLTPDDMYDTYHWAPTSVLDGLITIPEDTDREGWKVVTEDLVDLILGTAPEGKTQWTPTEAGGLADTFTVFNGQSAAQPDPTSYKITGKSLGEKIEGIPSGFYVVIARGNNVDKYVCTHEPNGEDPEHMTRTVTLATSEKYTYQYAAEMFALPTKDEEIDENGDPKTNTANGGEWHYDYPVVLKAEVRGRGGSLEIIKNLELYEYRKKEVGDNPRDIKDNVTFVFEVTAYENEASYKEFGDAARIIYHNFVSINYKDENGIKKAIVEDLPVGAYVVVKEVYSGRSYTATVEEDSAVIKPDEAAQVEFENKYDKTQGGGGSFVNNFKFATFTDEEGNSKNIWQPNRVDDNSTESTVVKPFESTK